MSAQRSMNARRSLGRRMLGVVLTVTALGLPLAPELRAQGGPPGKGRGGEGDRGGMAQRDQLERRFQERLDAIVKQRLNLTDEQHGKLREVASRTEEARRQLRRDEYAVRMALRRELMAGDKASETKVGELIDQMPKLERRRLDLMEQEQRELAKFLSPIQRVRYFGLQEELRRGMQEMQRRRMDRDSTHRHSPSDSETSPTRRQPDQR